MEIEILEFQVPDETNKTLLVWGIEPSHSKAQVYVSPPASGLGEPLRSSSNVDACVFFQEKLYSIFSCFGPLYLLKVCPNAPQSPPGFYALIKFYSALQASRAQRDTDGQALFQTSALKVALVFFLLLT